LHFGGLGLRRLGDLPGWAAWQCWLADAVAAVRPLGSVQQILATRTHRRGTPAWRYTASLSTSTEPVRPSSEIDAPDSIAAAAGPIPTTAGTRISRRTVAALARAPPSPARPPAVCATSGAQPAGRTSTTATSPGPAAAASRALPTRRARPRARPAETPDPRRTRTAVGGLRSCIAFTPRAAPRLRSRPRRAHPGFVRIHGAARTPSAPVGQAATASTPAVPRIVAVTTTIR